MTTDVCPRCGDLLKFGSDAETGALVAWCPYCDYSTVVKDLAA